MLRNDIHRVLGEFDQKIRNVKDLENHEFEFRNEIIAMFESLITMYLFGKDISKEKLTMNVYEDGQYKKKEFTVYKAIE